VGFVVDKVALWQVFSEYFDFPCQFTIDIMGSMLTELLNNQLKLHVVTSRKTVFLIPWKYAASIYPEDGGRYSSVGFGTYVLGFTASYPRIY
jgi:putative lipoic acid-binding regulatory protein